MASKDSKAQKPLEMPKGMQEVNPFGDSGDGWFQYPEQAEMASMQPIYGVFLGTVMVKADSDYSDEPRPVHKIRLLHPVSGAMGAKGSDDEGKLIDLDTGKIVLVWGKADLDQKLFDQEGAEVFIKTAGMKKIGNGRTMWEFVVGVDKVPPPEERAKIRARNEKRGKKAANQVVPAGVSQPTGGDDIPF